MDTKRTLMKAFLIGGAVCSFQWAVNLYFLLTEGELLLFEHNPFIATGELITTFIITLGLLWMLTLMKFKEDRERKI